MEKWQHTNHTVFAIKPEDLFELLDVRADVIVAEHDPFWITCAATGENHGRQVIKLDRFATPEQPFQRAKRCQPGQNKRDAPLKCPWAGRNILQELCLNPHLQLYFFQKHSGS